MSVQGRPVAIVIRLWPAEAMSKLKITRFQGVALPLPRCREADIERSNKPLFALNRKGVRFGTLWASTGRSTSNGICH
jgi:hypothetical protein